jgi:hypothetical protein
VEKVTYEIIDQLKEFKLFVNVGKNMNVEVPGFTQIQPLTDLSQVERSLKSLTWENFTLEARNCLTIHLHQKYRNQYQDWNKVTELYKAQLSQFDSAYLLLPTQLQQIVRGCFQWEVLGMCMESYYQKLDKKLPKIFANFLPIYEAGHLPCGWLGTIPQTEQEFRMNLKKGILQVY